MHLYYIYICRGLFFAFRSLSYLYEMTLTLEVTMGIRADHAMITCLGWRDVWGPRVRRGVGQCIL